MDGTQALAIVGVAKNCGKTTTLNALLARAGDQPVGLVSMGIDGEPADLLLGTPKPTIRVRPGQWVVSAQDALDVSTARVEYVAPLPMRTPMGRVFVVEVREPGEVMLAGIRHREDLRVALGELAAQGAGPIFIDGAYGRTAAAHPDLCDGVILSTGAIISPALDEIVEATAALVDRFTLESAPELWQRELLARALDQERALLGGPELAPQPLSHRSALLGLASASWEPAHQALAVPGLVSDRVIEELLAVTPAPEQPRRALLIPDGTALHASPRLMRRLRARWDLWAGQACPLRAITYNPTSPVSAGVDPEALERALEARFAPEHPGLPLFDPVRQGVPEALAQGAPRCGRAGW